LAVRGGRIVLDVSDAARPFVIDADGHVIEPPDLWDTWLEPRFRARRPRPVRDENGRFGYAVGDVLVMRTAASLAVPAKDGGFVRPPLGGADPEQRLADMDVEGIDVAILYPTLSFFFPEVGDAELHAALCRAYNDWLADYCRAAPARLVGVALLPLEDVEASIRELERCTDRHGFRGAFFRPNPYAGRPIQHPAYHPFWERAQALGVPITVHEGVSDALPTLGRDRTANPVALHLMSHPFEQMAACAGLILGGVLERFPDLRFVFLESGSGWLPYWLNRMDEHCETWGRSLPAIKAPPSAYFRRQCFIAMDPCDAIAASTVELVGDDVVVWSSDYPHPDAPFPGAVQKSLEILARLPAASVRRVMGENALRLYRLPIPRS
jgi:predicted TIM-barrel fold metal-dependent hydrolase